MQVNQNGLYPPDCGGLNTNSGIYTLHRPLGFREDHSTFASGPPPPDGSFYGMHLKNVSRRENSPNNMDFGYQAFIGKEESQQIDLSQDCSQAEENEDDDGDKLVVNEEDYENFQDDCPTPFSIVDDDDDEEMVCENLNASSRKRKVITMSVLKKTMEDHVR